MAECADEAKDEGEEVEPWEDGLRALLLDDGSNGAQSSSSNRVSLPMRLRRDVVMAERIVLKPEGGLQLVKAPMYALSEGKAPPPGSDLRINIIRSTNLEDNVAGNSPSLACNRLRMAEEHEHWPEPVRSRDKIYLQEKADILSSYDPHPVAPQDPPLRLGKYAKNQPIPSFYWSPAFQALCRKQRLLRAFRYISETYCLVDVYGVGVSGRVFAEGSSAGRMLVFEAYSFWNCEKVGGWERGREGEREWGGVG